jgi:hypothetical protein
VAGATNAYTPGEKLVVRLRLTWDNNNNKLGSKEVTVYKFSGDRIEVRDFNFVTVALK